MMSRFEDLCADFNRRRPAEPPIGRMPWFKETWQNGDDATNDLLVRFLIDHGYEYIRTMNGDIWFLYNGNWRRCDREVTGDEVQFFLLDYIDN